MSVSTFAATARCLEAYPENYGDHTALVSVDDCTGLLAAIHARSGLCVSRLSHEFAGQLVGFYPAREVVDAKTYIAGMTALFCAYAEDFVKRVCDPVTGVPSQSKWLPTLAEVKVALEAEKVRRDNLMARASWTIKETDRRRRAAEEAVYYKPGTEAERKAFVEKAINSLQQMVDQDERRTA